MRFVNLRKLTFATIIGGLALSTSTAPAATIHSNDILDSNPSASNPYTTGQTVAANMTATGIGRGTGINANAGSGRYNATAWNLSALDANDYFSWTLTPNANFKIDFTSLTGAWQRSGSGPSSYAFRSSLDNYASDLAAGSIGSSFNFNLGATAFDSITTPISFRLYAWGGSAGGTFSVNDFVFDGTISALATGNNSIITAPGSTSFNRVILGQTPSLNVNLTKTGSDATNYAATPSNNGLGVTASGSFAAGSQSHDVGIQLQNNSNGSATTGSKAYTLTVDNTASNSAAAGQGSADPNDVVNVTATVVGNRTINASAVNLGSVIVGATTSIPHTLLSTSGDDSSNTRVTLSGAIASNGEVTVAPGANIQFNDALDSDARDVSGSFATAGPKSGNIALSVVGEGLVGEAVNSLDVSYTAAAFDPSSAEFTGGVTTLSLDFGTFAQGSGLQSLSDAILNALQMIDYTAGLDLDSIGISGDIGLFSTDLAIFSNLAAGSSQAFSVFFDTNNAPGNYSATYTLGFSDADAYAGASASSSQQLTIQVTGTIVPEPTTFALAGVSLIGLALNGRNRRS